MNCWEVLGLAPGAETREIKRRFAQLVKINRPEDDAPAYQRLRHAYEEALSWEPTNDVLPAQHDVVEHQPATSEHGAPVPIGVAPSRIPLPRASRPQPEPVSPGSTLSWRSVLDELLMANESKPQEAEKQLADAVARLAWSDLKSRLLFEENLALTLSRVFRPLLMLAAAEKFKWNLNSGGNFQTACSVINEKCALWRLLAAEIGPLFFADMTAIEEIESGDRLKALYQNYAQDAENRPWFDAVVLTHIAQYDLSSALLGLVIEQIEWSFKAQKTLRNWSLSERFYALETIHPVGYKKLCAALGCIDGVYHTSKKVVSYIKAAELKHAVSRYNLGLLYELGEDVEQDAIRAFFWYACAAKQGDADAQYALGLCYRNGSGTVQDDQQALVWLQKSAEQGKAIARYELGRLYYDAASPHLRDGALALHWLGKAAQQGLAFAQNSLGTLYYEGRMVDKNYSLALEWFSQAARQGNTLAQYNLGQLYSNNETGLADYPKALYWLTQAANQNYGDAQFKLGFLYFAGEDIPQNMPEAIRWLTCASRHHYVDAFNLLGSIYLGGHGGVPVDYSQSLFWYEKAAKRGHTSAQNLVAFMYANGVGTEENAIIAWAWILISGGNDPRIKQEQIRRKMSGRDLAEAEEIARQYRQKYRLNTPEFEDDD
ncbi:J domain-containing protein [Klebsiella oxytoca]|uniref:J domain-containing protein n=1 Tax=Klebsiella oxytoca TaxID=571 RepID=UPI00339C2D29